MKGILRSVLIGLLLISKMAFSTEWQGPYKFSKFKSNFVAGAEHDRDVYIGLVHSSGVPLKPLFKTSSTSKIKPDVKEEGQWVAGKVSTLYRGISYALDETEQHSKEYLIFAPDNPQSYAWVGASDGNYPDNAVSIWGTPSEGVLCRARWAGAVLPGTLIPIEEACFIAYGGKQKRVYVYEILVKVDAARQ